MIYYRNVTVKNKTKQYTLKQADLYFILDRCFGTLFLFLGEKQEIFVQYRGLAPKIGYNKSIPFILADSHDLL